AVTGAAVELEDSVVADGADAAAIDNLQRAIVNGGGRGVAGGKDQRTAAVDRDDPREGSVGGDGAGAVVADGDAAQAADDAAPADGVIVAGAVVEGDGAGVHEGVEGDVA